MCCVDGKGWTDAGIVWWKTEHWRICEWSHLDIFTHNLVFFLVFCQLFISSALYIIHFYTIAQEVVSIRGNPHVLVVGDPGLGKSQVSSSQYASIYV